MEMKQPVKLEPKSESNTLQKRNTLQDLMSIVFARIGRTIDNTEIRALGYLIERNISAGGNMVEDDAFLESVFGITKEDDSRTAAWKINSKIFELKTAHCRDLETGAATQENAKKQRAVLDFMSAAHKSAEISYEAGDANVDLGAVPEYFLPDWVKAL